MCVLLTLNTSNLSYKVESKNDVPLLRCKLITPHIALFMPMRSDWMLTEHALKSKIELNKH